jgi:hypothetical protein
MQNYTIRHLFYLCNKLVFFFLKKMIFYLHKCEQINQFFFLSVHELINHLFYSFVINSLKHRHK